jgi:hypothetical protein
MMPIAWNVIDAFWINLSRGTSYGSLLAKIDSPKLEKLKGAGMEPRVNSST